MKLKQILPIAAASLIALTATAYDKELDTRMDFYDMNDTLVGSRYVDGTVFYHMFAGNRWINSITPDCKRIEFIHPGSKPYTVEFSSSSPDVKVSVGMPTNGNAKVAAKSESQTVEASYGQYLGFRIDVPEGHVPICHVVYQLTSGTSYYNQSFYSNFYNFRYYLNDYRATDMKNRNAIAKVREYETFSKSWDEKNVWYFDYVMPNEPVKLVFSSAPEADPQYMRDAMKGMFYSLYEQKGTMLSNQGVGSNHSPAGESTILDIYGNCHSDDFISNLVVAEDKDHNISGLEGLMKGNGYFACYGWEYCYSLITYANLLLDNIDAFKDTMPQEELDVIKAQLLTIRANAYFNIMRIYGPRWDDSQNGSVLCAPLETTFNLQNQAPASMKEIADRCYQDLDEAITLFKTRNYQRKYIVEPDINVARSVKMRVAMLRQDYSAAKSLATEILEEKPLSTNNDVLNGFTNHADSWIWGAQEKQNYDENKLGSLLYYWAAGQKYNSNGAYAGSWTLGAAAIDKDLYLSIPDGDVRQKQFALSNKQFNLSVRSILPKIEDWHGGTNVDATNLFYLKDSNWVNYSKSASTAFSRILPDAVKLPAFQWESSKIDSGDNLYVPFTYGANIKFLNITECLSGDNGDVCFMRADEVLLTKAEACNYLGEEDEARELLSQLNTIRNSKYTCAATGYDLFNEIRKYRRIELWGEGHSWFDSKRWKLPLTRNIYRADDTNSGNWHSSYMPEVAVDVANGWRYPVPRYYVRQNDLVNVEAMGYKGVKGYEDAPASAPAKMFGIEKAIPGADRILQMDRMYEIEQNEPSKEMQTFIAE